MRIHFIAIGGAAMHNLALELSNKGNVVSGSDDEIFEPSRSRLLNAGLLPKEYGWHPDTISPEIEAVILGMHAREDNPELLCAQQMGLKIYSYPEFLYEQTKDKKRVVIGGSHGKTTITSMIMHVLKETGIPFDYMVGSQIEGFDTMVSLKKDTSIAVFEGDEYLSSPIDRRPKFHLYMPHIALINGIAWDHINVFPSFEIYKEQFKVFIDKIEAGGELFYNLTDRETVELVNKTEREDIRICGFDEPQNRVKQGVSQLHISEDRILDLHFFGSHNMQNMAGAKSVCTSLGVSDELFYGAISSFKGSKKRMQKLYEDNTSKVYLDFAHAPSKVEATVKAITKQFPNHNVVVCFELHTFSSLNKEFISGYKNTLDGTDEALVFYNPEVVEHKKLPAISKAEVLSAFARKDISIAASKAELSDQLRSRQKQDNTVFLFMSSGSFGGLSQEELVDLALK